MNWRLRSSCLTIWIQSNYRIFHTIVHADQLSVWAQKRWIVHPKCRITSRMPEMNIIAKHIKIINYHHSPHLTPHSSRLRKLMRTRKTTWVVMSRVYLSGKERQWRVWVWSIRRWGESKEANDFMIFIILSILRI